MEERLSGGELLVRVRDGVATVTLNRPAVLNALSFGMLRALGELLDRWEQDAAVRSIVLRGAGPKAFCAGGDVRALRQQMLDGGAGHHEFFRTEYALDHRLHAYGKPVVAVLEGIVMGGGMGISQGAALRIAGPGLRMAMPETGIGLFPDVGGSWFLSRAPGEIGVYLGLAGVIIGPADAIHAGLADVAFDADALDQVEAGLAEEEHDVSRLAARGSRSTAGSRLAFLRDAIDLHFSRATVREIVQSLESEARPEYRDWARETAMRLRRRSPTLLAVTLRQLRAGRALSLGDCFRMELNLIHACFDHGDMVEGIRAALVDKDHAPRWNPASIEALDPAEVDRFFAPRWPRERHPLAQLHP